MIGHRHCVAPIAPRERAFFLVQVHSQPRGCLVIQNSGGWQILALLKIAQRILSLGVQPAGNSAGIMSSCLQGFLRASDLVWRDDLVLWRLSSLGDVFRPARK